MTLDDVAKWPKGNSEKVLTWAKELQIDLLEQRVDGKTLIEMAKKTLQEFKSDFGISYGSAITCCF